MNLNDIEIDDEPHKFKILISAIIGLHAYKGLEKVANVCRLFNNAKK